MRRSLFACVLLVALLLVLNGSDAQEKPRVIKVLGTGKAEGMPVLTTWFSTEPSTDPTIVPTRVWGAVSHADIRRFMRIYFPRTYDDLLAHEFYFMAQVDLAFFTPEQQKWIYDALSNHERGGANTRSIISTHAEFHIPWRDSLISDAFPNDVAAVIEDISNKEGEPGPLVVKDGDDIPKIMKPYKAQIEGVFTNYGGLNTIPKQGAVVLSYTKNNKGFGSPVPGQVAHVFYWRWNRSVTFTLRDMVYDTFWSPVTSGSLTSNPYALDIVANIIWFSTGRELPQDPLRVHDLRRDLFIYNIQKSLLSSLLEFAESFGANPIKEYARIGEIEAQRRVVADLYLDGEFEDAYDVMKTVLADLKDLEEDATELKDRALFWVYVVEWSVTTGVFLIAGIVLWTLMVRRALYREVSATKWAR